MKIWTLILSIIVSMSGVYAEQPTGWPNPINFGFAPANLATQDVFWNEDNLDYEIYWGSSLNQLVITPSYDGTGTFDCFSTVSDATGTKEYSWTMQVSNGLLSYVPDSGYLLAGDYDGSWVPDNGTFTGTSISPSSIGASNTGIGDNGGGTGDNGGGTGDNGNNGGGVFGVDWQSALVTYGSYAAILVSIGLLVIAIKSLSKTIKRSLHIPLSSQLSDPPESWVIPPKGQYWKDRHARRHAKSSYGLRRGRGKA